MISTPLFCSINISFAQLLPICNTMPSTFLYKVCILFFLHIYVLATLVARSHSMTVLKTFITTRYNRIENFLGIIVSEKTFSFQYILEMSLLEILD